MFHRTLSPSGPLPKKKVANVLDDQRHPMLLNVNRDMLEREVAAPWGPMAYAGVWGIKEHFIFLGLNLGTNKIERWNWGLGSEIWASTLRFGPQEQDLSFKAGNRAKSWY